MLATCYGSAAHPRSIQGELFLLMSVASAVSFTGVIAIVSRHLGRGQRIPPYPLKREKPWETRGFSFLHPYAPTHKSIRPSASYQIPMFLALLDETAHTSSPHNRQAK